MISNLTRYKCINNSACLDIISIAYNTKSVSVDECSVKFVGSVINCFRLYYCIRPFILLLLS